MLEIVLEVKYIFFTSTFKTVETVFRYKKYQGRDYSTVVTRFNHGVELALAHLHHKTIWNVSQTNQSIYVLNKQNKIIFIQKKQITWGGLSHGFLFPVEKKNPFAQDLSIGWYHQNVGTHS